MHHALDSAPCRGYTDDSTGRRKKHAPHREKAAQFQCHKLIAIAAMTVDHIAWAAFPGYPKEFLPLLMHLIGRVACPIMCYSIAEGYHYTRNIRKYTARLFIFALISHFCYIYSSRDFIDWRSFIPFYYGGALNQTSVMWSLAWGLVMLRVAESKKITSGAVRVLLILLICLVSFPSDWSCIASLCVMAFGTNRGDDAAIEDRFYREPEFGTGGFAAYSVRARTA